MPVKFINEVCNRALDTQVSGPEGGIPHLSIIRFMRFSDSDDVCMFLHDFALTAELVLDSKWWYEKRQGSDMGCPFD